MQSFNKLAHAVWECKYHVVWCPKYRFKVLSGELRKSVREIIRQLCEWKRIEIIEGNVQTDHIHFVLSVPPKYSISEAVGLDEDKVRKYVRWLREKDKRMDQLQLWK